MKAFVFHGSFLFALLAAYGCGLLSFAFTLLDVCPRLTLALALSCAILTQTLMRCFKG